MVRLDFKGNSFMRNSQQWRYIQFNSNLCVLARCSHCCRQFSSPGSLYRSKGIGKLVNLQCGVCLAYRHSNWLPLLDTEELRAVNVSSKSVIEINSTRDRSTPFSPTILLRSNGWNQLQLIARLNEVLWESCHWSHFPELHQSACMFE